jgi:uncharacterized membrane protein
MNKLIYKIVKLFKPQIDRWIIKTLVVAGIMLITTGLTGLSWYVQLFLHIVEIESKQRLGKNYSIGIIDWATVIIGFILLAIGIIVYYLNKNFENQKKGDFVAIVHKSIDNFIAPDYGKLVNQKEYNIREIIIDQTNLYSNGTLEYPEASIFQQNNLLSKIDALTKNVEKYQIGYFGLAHIPLTWEVGSTIADKFKISYFEYDRNKSIWKKLSKDSNNQPAINISSKIINSVSDNAIIKIEISYEILDTKIFEVVSDCESFITISNPNIGLDKITDLAAIVEYSKVFRNQIDKIISNGLIKNIHIFYSGPVSMGLALSRKISKRTDPTFFIYNYNRNAQPVYKWALKISNSQPEIKKL